MSVNGKNDGSPSSPREEERTLRTTRADFVAALFLALFPAVFFFDVLIGAGRFFVRDITRFYYPVKVSMANIVRSGEFPWWNPFYAAGQPIAANPEYAVFYPVQWLIFLPDFDLGFHLHILVHLSIGLVSMYVLLRSLRLMIIPSLYGSIAWGLGGVVLSSINLLPILFVVSWMPLFLFALRRAIRDRTMGAVALAGAIGGLQILAGEPTTLIQTWILSGAFVIWLTLSRPKPNRRRNLAIGISVFALSLFIGAIQLVPAIDHVRDTVRARGLGLDLITHWSFPLIRLIELVQPFLLGFHNVDGRIIWWGGALYPRAASPFLMNLYSGALLLPLVFAGLCSRHTRRWAYLGIAIPFLVVAVGSQLPLFAVAMELGLPIPIRFPEKLVLGFVFVSVVYAASVLDRGLRGDRRVLQIGVAAAATMTVLATAGWMITTGAGGAEYLERWGLAPALITDHAVELVGRGWMISSALMFTGTIVLVGLLRGGRLWRQLLVAVVTVEMLILSLDIAPRIDPGLFQPPPVLDLLPADPDQWRLFHEADWYGTRFFNNGPLVYWELVNGLYPLTPAVWNHATALQRDYDLTQLLATVELAEAMWRVREAGQPEWREIFMKISNARVRLELAPEPPAQIVHVYPWLIDPIAVVDIGPVPRYYFASEVRRISGLDQFVEALSSEVPPDKVAFVSELEPFDPASGAVERIRETSSTIQLDVDTTGRSFLVLSVSHHRYWRATIDGEPTPIVQTNIGYQGIVVPPGKHSVRLGYRNPVITAAAPISAGAILVTLAALIWPAVRRYRLP